MPLATTEIEKQSADGLCVHAATANVLKLCGRTPPPPEQIAEDYGMLMALRRQAVTVPGIETDPAAPTAFDMLALLNAYGAGCVMGMVPPQLMGDPRPLFSYWLDADCPVVLFYLWRSPETGRLVPHVAVAEGLEGRGYVMLDGAPAGFSESGLAAEGSLVNLEPPMWTAEQLEAARPEFEARPHGSRVVLPYGPVVTADMGRVGLLPQYVAVLTARPRGLESEDKR